MDGVGVWVMRNEGVGGKAQSNRMCYRYIKMVDVGRRIIKDECATDYQNG